MHVAFAKSQIKKKQALCAAAHWPAAKVPLHLHEHLHAPALDHARACPDQGVFNAVQV